MGFKIEDGLGHGRLAAVTPHNALSTSGVIFSGEERAVWNGDSFILHGECHLAAATDGGLLSFANTSPIWDIFITRIYIDAHTLTTNVIVKQLFDATIANGTDISLTGIINKNRGSGSIIDGTLVISDGSSDMTYTGGIQYHSYPVVSMNQYTRNMRGTNRLTLNTSIVFGWEAVTGSATDGEIVSLSVNGYREEKAHVEEQI